MTTADQRRNTRLGWNKQCKRSRSTSTEASQSHDCHDHLHRASDTSTLHWVNLQESRRFHEEVFGFEVVQLRKSVGYAFQGSNLLTRHPVRIGCDLRSKVKVFVGGEDWCPVLPAVLRRSPLRLARSWHGPWLDLSLWAGYKLGASLGS